MLTRCTCALSGAPVDDNARRPELRALGSDHEVEQTPRPSTGEYSSDVPYADGATGSAPRT
jgi:hypothetical protein